MTKPILVGEANPYGGSPEFALWPDPPNCSGWRLCHRIFNMQTTEYLRAFDRVNLCPHRWSMPMARDRAHHIKATMGGPLILLGSKVCSGFDIAFQPFTVQTSILGPDREVLILPHPSGRSTAWNDPKNAERARLLVRQMRDRLSMANLA